MMQISEELRIKLETKLPRDMEKRPSRGACSKCDCKELWLGDISNTFDDEPHRGRYYNPIPSTYKMMQCKRYDKIRMFWEPKNI
jgi:hypothetical protein